MIKLFGNDGKTCLYVHSKNSLTDKDISTVCATFNVSVLPSFLDNLIEVGPMPSMESPWGSNAKSILKKCGIHVDRIERSRLYIPLMFDKSKDMDKMTEIIYESSTINDFTKCYIKQDYELAEITSIKDANEKYQLGFDDMDIQFYEDVYKRLGRNPTLIELFDLSQSNSEHSRHWFFKGKLIHPELGEIPESLFQMVKNTLKNLEEERGLSKRTVVAFSDNSSSIEGFEIEIITPNLNTREYVKQTAQYDITFTAETHNFPTGIAPFQGATTGTGGRIRDNQSIGRGGLVVAGTAGYCVGEIDEKNSKYHEKNLFTLLKASDGASDYGNKFGEPLIGGFCRTFGTTGQNNQRIEWVKPIMFSGGIGQVMNQHSLKLDPEPSWLICKIGGPAYRIGVGGGAASSRDQNSKNANADLNAVQRGDAEMENKMNRVIRTCIELAEENPIASIHDQGAGGTGNVTKEIVYNPSKGTGGLVDLSKIVTGDQSMTDLELWISEYQEQNTVLIMPKHQQLLERICRRENVPFAIIGIVDNSGSVTVQSCGGEIVADFPLEPILGKNIPRKEYVLGVLTEGRTELNNDVLQVTEDDLLNVLSMPSVGSKRFLTNKVDRSVTGLVAQQQCVGPLHTPVSDYSVIAQSHFNLSGAATAIGERPLIGIEDSRAMAGMALGEMLTNLVFAQITNIHDIRISGNWMWPLKLKGEDTALYEACDELTKLCKEIGVALDGGKDSLSMIYKEEGDNPIPSPRQLVLSAYAPMKNIQHKITPNFKYVNTAIMFIDLSFGKNRLGGSSLYHSLSQSCSNVPKMENGNLVRDVFNIIQSMWFVDDNYSWYTLEDGDYCVPYSCGRKERPVQLISGHDRSDGGLFTTICEMCISGNVGAKLSSKYIRNDNYESDSDRSDSDRGESDRESENSSESSEGEIASENGIYKLSEFAGTLNENIEFWFNEELGLVLEIPRSHVKKITSLFGELETKYNTEIVHYLGETCEDYSISFDDSKFDLGDIRMKWEESSLKLETKQCDQRCAMEETNFLKSIEPNYNAMQYPNINTPINPILFENLESENRPKVAIIREEGSNGDREMASAFYMAGFDVHDICMNDFIDESISLDQFKGIAFVGGFSYSDVGGAAQGWYQVIKNNDNVRKEFDRFYNRNDTFSLGICNGCQLMSLLEWIPNVTMVQNESKRFESRFPRVLINKSNAMMFKNMEDSVLGVWVAHGEGQFVFNNRHNTFNGVVCQYVDEDCQPTEKYPLNPNGSIFGAAAVCSQDGRHLAMMPHPERCFLRWQMPYKQGLIMEEDESKFKQFSPWFGMFCNAYEFCTTNN